MARRQWFEMTCYVIADIATQEGGSGLVVAIGAAIIVTPVLNTVTVVASHAMLSPTMKMPSSVCHHQRTIGFTLYATHWRVTALRYMLR